MNSCDDSNEECTQLWGPQVTKLPKSVSRVLLTKAAVVGSHVSPKGPKDRALAEFLNQWKSQEEKVGDRGVLADITDPQPSFQHLGESGANNREGCVKERMAGEENGRERRRSLDMTLWGGWQAFGKRQSVQSDSLPMQQRPVWIAQSHQEPGKRVASPS